MVTTRARGRGAPAPAPALTKGQKAEIAAMKKVENEKKKAEKAAVKAAAKAVKEKEKAAAKAIKDRAKAAAKAAKEKEKAAANAKTRPKPKVAAKVKSSKVGKAAKTKSSKLGKRANASKPVYDDEDDDETETESESDSEPVHKRRRIKDGSSSVAVVVNSKGSRTKERRAAVDLISIDINDWDYSKELPPPEDLQTNIQGVLPRIYVGGSAPQPRWLVGQNKVMPPPFSETGLKRRYSEGHGSTEYGKLVWYLDEGAFSLWNGLEYPQLFELAYKCFEDSLKKAAVRDEIHQTLADGALPETLASSEEWYPTLPPPPKTKYFGIPSDGPVWDVSQEQTHPGYYYMDNDRPSLAVQPSRTSLHPSQHILASKLLDQITTHSDRSMDASQKNSASGGRFSRSARFNQLSVNSNRNLEQTQGPGPSDAVGAQRKAGRIGESSSNGSVVSDDSQDDAGLEPNSAHDSRDQSPQSLFVDSESDAEVSALSIINDAQTDDADGTSAESTHTSRSSSVASYDGLFSASQINEYYDTKQKEFKQDHLGGKRKHTENAEDKNVEDERAEKRVNDTLAAFEKAREQVARAMAQEQASKDKGKGREAEGDEADSEDEHDVVDLSDPYFEQAQQVCNDEAARAKHFPDPIAVRRVRVWAGENLMADGPTNLNAGLPTWPDTHRPFHPWNAAPATTGSSKTASTKRAKVYTKPPAQKPLSEFKFKSFSLRPKTPKP